MTTNNTNKICLQCSDDLLSDDICWLVCLPYEILEIIIHFLNGKDINALSQTCRKFCIFFNVDQFWRYLIYRDFPKSIAQFYTVDLFKKPDIIEIHHNEIHESNFAHIRPYDQLNILAIHSATHYNDVAIERRHGKMYVSKEDFVNNLEFFQFKNLNKSLNILFNKIIYFYLIDRKRCAAADMDIANLNEYFIAEEYHSDSLTNSIIHLHSARSLDISGRFQHKIMPGKYEISWRMKTDKYGISIWGITEFIVVPQHGKVLNYRMHENDFHHLIFKHENEWSIIKMGQTIIYEPSIVLVAIRNWNNLEWKYGLLLDCIELTILE